MKMTHVVSGLLGVALAGTIGCSMAPAPAKVFYLNPGAATEGDGTEAKPFKTFDAARKAVAAAVKDAALTPGDVVVEVASGRFFLKDAQCFGAADSGTAAHPVRWRAAEKGKTRLTGGRDLPAAVKPDAATLAKLPAAARDHVLEFDLKAAGISVAAKDAALVWGESFLTPARWPNEGFTGIKAVKDLGKDAKGERIKPNAFTYSDNRVDAWADETDARATGYFMFDWAASTVDVAKIDPATHTLTQVGKCNHYGYSKRGYWYGVNVLREIDLPGEYHFARKEGKLRVWPPAGAPAQPPQVTVTDRLFRFRDVANVAFEGFVFENTRSEAVVIERSRNVGFTADTFVNVGKACAVSLCHGVRIDGCDILHCNAGGISVYGDRKEYDALTPSDIVIDNCHITDYARMVPTYCGGISFGQVCGATVKNCLIHHAPHVAIIFTARELKLLNNEIHSVCLDSGEMGAVYCGRDWTLCGNLIEGNYFHDIGLSRNGYNPNRAIMIDDGGAGLTMRKNRFIRIAEGISLSAVGNRIEQNLFVENWPSISGWQIWDAPKCYEPSHYTHDTLLNRFHALPVTEEPWKSKYPYLALMLKAEKTGTLRDPATSTVVADNVVVGGPTNAFFFSWRNYDKPAFWSIGANVRSADGHEADAFLPPLETTGLYESDTRASWPVRHVVKRNDSKKMFHKANYRPMR